MLTVDKEENPGPHSSQQDHSLFSVQSERHHTQAQEHYSARLGCIELHHHKLVTVHKVAEVPICQDNDILIINLGVVVHFLLTIESRQNLKIVVILEVFIVVLRFIVPSEVVRIRLVSVLSYASVIVRFEETGVFIVIFGCGFGQRLIGEANRDRRR
nr:hypothetical protein Iba_chr12dCG18210 [Ipomoea batatas]